MSAFLFFSQDRRGSIKEKHPGIRNTEVSKMLGEIWRNAPECERKPFVELEQRERAKYKVKIAQWREEETEKKTAQRKRQEVQTAKRKFEEEQHFEQQAYHPGDQMMEPNIMHAPFGPPPPPPPPYIPAMSGGAMPVYGYELLHFPPPHVPHHHPYPIPMQPPHPWSFEEPPTTSLPHFSEEPDDNGTGGNFWQA